MFIWKMAYNSNPIIIIQENLADIVENCIKAFLDRMFETK